MNISSNRIRFTGVAMTLGLTLAACGGSTGGTAATSPTGTSTVPSTAPSAAATTGASASASFGAGCAAVPTTGKGSFSGMVGDPVATAASNNPLLSTLVTAVTAAGLGDTLNSAKGITVFAPSNDAFKKVPADALKGLLADKAALTKVLTYHVIGERLTPKQLATGGPFKTLEGGMVTVKGSGEAFTVGTGNANIVCGNVQTANATVYIIDSVLSPTA